MTEDQHRSRFEIALGIAWVLWHMGLSPGSIFLLLGTMLRQEERAKGLGAEFRVLVGPSTITVLPPTDPDAPPRRRARA